MTVKDVITWATHNVYEEADHEAIAGWLSRLDARIYRDIIRPRAGHESYEEPKEYSAERGEQVLLLAVPDDELYHAYIEYRLRTQLGEDARAGDAAALYNELYRAFAVAYTREHPAGRVRFRY